MYRHKTNRLRSDVSLSWRALCRLTTKSLLEYYGRISSLLGNHRSRWTQTVSTQMRILAFTLSIIPTLPFAIAFHALLQNGRKGSFKGSLQRLCTHVSHMYAVVVAWLDYQPSNAPLVCPLEYINTLAVNHATSDLYLGCTIYWVMC